MKCFAIRIHLAQVRVTASVSSQRRLTSSHYVVILINFYFFPSPAHHSFTTCRKRAGLERLGPVG